LRHFANYGILVGGNVSFHVTRGLGVLRQLQLEKCTSDSKDRILQDMLSEVVRSAVHDLESR
jgi:hypothetical protein